MNLAGWKTWHLLTLAGVIILAAATLVLLFEWDRQPGANEALAEVTPSATAAWPTVLTNTPTVTPLPTSTPGPTDTPAPTATPVPTATSTPTPTPTPIIVNPKIQALGRLEAAQYIMQTVVDLEREPGNVWQQFFGNDKLLLVAEGQVVVGFDLTKVEENDIVVDGDTVHLTLPPPEILYTGVDEDKTYVYERETGLFVPPDPALETDARRVAQKSILNWALEHDAFGKAEEFGILYMESFLRSLGFTEVDVEVYRPLEVE